MTDLNQLFTRIRFEKRTFPPTHLIHFEIKGWAFYLSLRRENHKWVAEKVFHRFYDICPFCRCIDEGNEFKCAQIFPVDFLLNHPHVRLQLLFEQG